MCTWIKNNKPRTLCPRDDWESDRRPCMMWKGTEETWEGLPCWDRYCRFITMCFWRWGTSNMEAIEWWSGNTIEQWAKLLGLTKEQAMRKL